MIKIILLALNALRKGSMLADPAVWKNRATAIILVTGLIAVLLKIAKVYGYEIQLTDEDIAAIAGTVVTLVSLYFNYATSDKVGILPPKPGTDDGLLPGSKTDDALERDVSGPN